MLCEKCFIEKNIQYFRKDSKICKNCQINEKRKKSLYEKNRILSLEIINYSREDFFNYCKKRSFNLKKMPLIEEFINKKIKLDLDFKTKVYLYYKEIESPPLCAFCNKRTTKLINTNKGFFKFCSTKCASNSEEKKSKTKSTNLEKWGCISPLSNESIKNKIKRTNLEKWGVENVSQSLSVKKKKSKTMLDNFGVEFNSQRLEVKRNLSKKMSLLNSKLNTNRHAKYWENKLSNIDLDLVSKSIGSIIEIRCDEGNHSFSIHKTTFNDRIKNGTPLCTICNPVGDLKSFKEREVLNWIKSIYSGEIIESYRDGLEIDIYLPDLRLGLEFNGLYWHSEEFKDKWYHLNKTNFFKESGIRIIHIWEDDWIFRKDIIKSQISNFIGVSKKIWARNCEVRSINDVKLVKNFLNKNHIQGFTSSKVKIGLFLNSELVSIMTFDQFEGRKKMRDGEWNLNRFCSLLDFSVIGAASKILSFFIKNYLPSRIISYSDRSWSTGQLYYKLGFTNLYDSNPDYKYVVGGKRLHKSNFRKSKTGMSESLLNYSKIWDCGKTKFELLT